jgi:hypothetical protein
MELPSHKKAVLRAVWAFCWVLTSFYRHLLIWAGGALGAVLPTKSPQNITNATKPTH